FDFWRCLRLRCESPFSIRCNQLRAFQTEQFKEILMRRSVAGAMFALVLVLAAVNVAAGQSATRTITGTVMDSANNKPLSQAGVYFGRMPAGQRTGNDGKFSVSAPPDALLLAVRRAGYVPVIVEVPADTVATDVGTKRLRQAKTDEDRAAVQSADGRLYRRRGALRDRPQAARQGECGG